MMSLLLHLSYISLLVSLSSGLNDKYHSNQEMAAILTQINNKYPDISHLYTIGKSVEGRSLTVLALSASSPNKSVPLRPEVKLVANIHGNEVVGRELLLNLAEYMTDNSASNLTIKNLLKSIRLHILVSINPDGFQIAEVGDCQGIVGRRNKENYDLNRNFPENFLPKPKNVKRQPETLSVISWMEETAFILSASLHGGAIVANYPYDNYNSDKETNSKDARYAKSPDDDLFRYMSLIYSRYNLPMMSGDPCGPDTKYFPNGITNGADWYPLAGGMQDYNYINHGCLELTLEVSCCKYPNPSDKPPSTYWNNNRDSLIAFLSLAKFGMRGYVKDKNNKIVSGAYVDIVGQKGYVKSSKTGVYHKILAPGTYQIQAALRYDVMSDIITVTIGETSYSMLSVNFTVTLPFVDSSSSCIVSSLLLIIQSMLLVFSAVNASQC